MPTKAVAAAVVALFCLASPAASFEVEGHRGARWARPENTLAAFRYALALGVDTLEMDLHATKDDVLVVTHDPFLNPDAVPGPRRQEDRREDPHPQPHDRGIEALRLRLADQPAVQGAGAPAQGAHPHVRGGPHLAGHLHRPKGPNGPSERRDQERGSASGVHPGARALHAPRAGVGPAAPAGRPFHPPVVRLPHARGGQEAGAQDDPFRPGRGSATEPLAALAKRVHADIVSPNHEWLTAEDVAGLHAAGVKVVPWTANTPEVWKKLVELGVDGIISDDPKALLEFRKGLKPAK